MPKKPHFSIPPIFTATQPTNSKCRTPPLTTLLQNPKASSTSLNSTFLNHLKNQRLDSARAIFNKIPFTTPSKPVFKTHCFLHTITAAISRTKKEETVESVRDQLENCYLLAGINYKGFTVKQFQDLRKSLPETTKLIVAKNNLVYKAIEGTQFETLKPCMKGMNVWLFVHTKEILSALKPYRDFQKEEKLEENDFTGAVFEGKFYGPDDFKTLETLPTRAQIYANLLGSLKTPASSFGHDDSGSGEGASYGS